MSFNISLCMVIRDEERFLSRCLASAAPYVSEIVVVDTGSADRSREIAASFGARILTIPWEDDFSQARNAGLEAARMPWILVLDADEVLVPPDPHHLETLLADPGVQGYFVQIRHRIGDGSSGEYVVDAACRLFRNDPAIRFQGTIHEEVVSAIRAHHGDLVKFSELVLWHDGYLDAVIAEKKKGERNKAILRKALESRPDDPVLLYAWGTEHFQQGAYPEALAAFERALTLAPVFSGYTSDLALKTAYCLRELGRRQEAAGLLQQAATLYPDFVDLLEWRAVLHLDDDRADRALPLLRQCLQMGPCDGRYSSASGAGTYRSHYLAGVCCERLWLWEEAVEHYRAALRIRPGYAPAWLRLAELALLLDRREMWSELVPLTAGSEKPPRWLNTSVRRRWPKEWQIAWDRRLGLSRPGKAGFAPEEQNPDRGAGMEGETADCVDQTVEDQRPGADGRRGIPAQGEPFRLPVDAPFSLLQTPRTVMEQWARRCATHLREPSYQEALLAGWLALESGLDWEASRWFTLATTMRPHRAAPRVGRYLAAVLSLRRHQPDLAVRLSDAWPDPDGQRRLLLAAAAEPVF
ncbi:MAG: glycosyltransferase [Kyrpidia sp.]|nr:glycosyltransferase [Kyrpidia sp.]